MPRRALLIVNAKSRSGAAQRDIAIERLRDHGIEPIHVDCARREDMSPLIVQHAKDVDCAVVGGGDGTLNAAAFGVIEAGLPLGILPLGTANDLARTLEIPSDLDAAAQVIADGHKRRRALGSRRNWRNSSRGTSSAAGGASAMPWWP
jgi:diacylglycerol kinase family enzyme